MEEQQNQPYIPPDDRLKPTDGDTAETPQVFKIVKHDPNAPGGGRRVFLKTLAGAAGLALVADALKGCSPDEPAGTAPVSSDDQEQLQLAARTADAPQASIYNMVGKWNDVEKQTEQYRVVCVGGEASGTFKIYYLNGNKRGNGTYVVRRQTNVTMIMKAGGNRRWKWVGTFTDPKQISGDVYYTEPSIRKHWNFRMMKLSSPTPTPTPRPTATPPCPHCDCDGLFGHYWYPN